MPSPRRHRYRLLAIDVDGTLLDREGRLLPSTAAAVARAAEAGIRPVLCTGRRYRRALPIARSLGLDAPLILNSGSLVKDPDGHRTLWRADFDEALLAAVLDLFDRRGEPVVSFADRDPSGCDFTVADYPTGREHFDQYVGLNREHAGIDPAWRDRPDAHFHVCAVGERPAMLDFQAEIMAALTGRVRTFVQKSPRYSGWMCEVLREDASKWSAVLHLADLWGVAPAEIVAVGDDMNDVPMIAGAGLGVAMGHAPAEVKAVADHITAGHDADGLGLFVDRVLLGP